MSPGPMPMVDIRHDWTMCLLMPLCTLQLSEHGFLQRLISRWKGLIMTVFVQTYLLPCGHLHLPSAMPIRPNLFPRLSHHLLCLGDWMCTRTRPKFRIGSLRSPLQLRLQYHENSIFLLTLGRLYRRRSITSSDTPSVDVNWTSTSYLLSFKRGVVQTILQLIILLPQNGSGYVTIRWPSIVLWHLVMPERLHRVYGLTTSNSTTTSRGIMVLWQLMKDFPLFGRPSSTCCPKLERNSAPIYAALVRRCLSFVTITTT